MRVRGGKGIVRRVFQFDARGMLAIVALAMCWVLARVLYRVGTPGGVARRLSLLLVIEGITLITAGYLDMLLTPAVTARPWYAGWFKAEFVVHTLGDCSMLALYPPFVAMALGTPLTRPMAHRRAQVGLAVTAAVLFFLVLTTTMRVGATLLYIGLAVVFWFALIGSIHAWSIAEGDPRNRARSFAIAFGIRDLCWGFVYALATWGIWQGTMAETPSDPNDPTYLVYLLGTLLAVPLVAYGILRTHLFDIDLRIRWTIKQSTLAATVVAIVYVISEGSSRLLSAELGNVAGLFAAAIVIFLLAPLQRFAERVATAAMPNTRDTPEYAAFRKLQVYEAAVKEAMQGGEISAKERALLNRLRDSLGISSVDAERIEREWNAAGEAGPSGSPAQALLRRST